MRCRCEIKSGSDVSFVMSFLFIQILPITLIGRLPLPKHQVDRYLFKQGQADLGSNFDSFLVSEAILINDYEIS